MANAYGPEAALKSKEIQSLIGKNMYIRSYVNRKEEMMASIFLSTLDSPFSSIDDTATQILGLHSSHFIQEKHSAYADSARKPSVSRRWLTAKKVRHGKHAEM